MPKKKRKPRMLGKRIRVWWYTGEKDNYGTILAVLPYTGRFTQYCDCVLRFPAPNTHRGYVEMAYHSSNFKYDSRR